MEKKCYKCGELKPAKAFGKNKAKADGLASECKLCKKKVARKWYKNNKDEIDRKNQEYRKTNREEVLAMCRAYYANNKSKWRESDLQKKYGMSIDDYNLMLTEQDGCCAICGRHTLELGKTLCVDHNHVTGEVRGLLCGNCNKGIGFLMEDASILSSAIEYLEEHDNE